MILDSLLAALLDWLLRQLSLRTPPRPGPLSLTLSLEARMAAAPQIKVTATLPALPTLDPTAPAITAVALTVTPAGGTPTTVPVALADKTAVLGTFDDKTTCTVELWYTNAAGHSGLHQSETFTASLADFPPQPGAFTFAFEEVVPPAA